MQNIITVQNISKSFGDTKAVCDLGFEVEKSTCFGFLGPNGAGKTTMMKMIYGKCTRDANCSGSIDVMGYDPKFNELEIKFKSGVVPQDDNLDEELNVFENLQLYARFYNLDMATAKKRITYLLDFLELPEKAKSKIRELSGGMKRRLVIARAILNEPDLLILDEPTTGLDPQVRHLIWDKLRQLKRQGTTMLLTTHYMEEAYQLCDNLIIMHKGSKIMEGKPGELLEQNVDKFVLELFSNDALNELKEGNILSTVKVNEIGEVVRLYSDHVDDLKQIANMIEGSPYHIRQANLEDVFLKATGSKLNERQ